MTLRIAQTLFGGTTGRAEPYDRGTKGKIASFVALPNGWNYGCGKPATPALAKEALAFHTFLERLGIEETDAFPGEEGEILLRAYTDEYCASFTFNANSTIDLSFERGDVEVYCRETASRAEMLSLAIKVAEKCGIFVSRTLSISTGEKADLWNLPSKNIPQMTPLQSLRRTAPFEVQGRFAITSKNIMPPTYRGVPQSFGSSMMPSYPLAQSSTTNRPTLEIFVTTT